MDTWQIESKITDCVRFRTEFDEDCGIFCGFKTIVLKEWCSVGQGILILCGGLCSSLVNLVVVVSYLVGALSPVSHKGLDWPLSK